MKLYVWYDVLCDYPCGIASAIAPTALAARKAIALDYLPLGKLDEEIKHRRRRRKDFIRNNLKAKPKAYSVNKPYAHHVYGG